MAYPSCFMSLEICNQVALAQMLLHADHIHTYTSEPAGHLRRTMTTSMIWDGQFFGDAPVPEAKRFVTKWWIFPDS